MRMFICRMRSARFIRKLKKLGLLKKFKAGAYCRRTKAVDFIEKGMVPFYIMASVKRKEEF